MLSSLRSLTLNLLSRSFGKVPSATPRLLDSSRLILGNGQRELSSSSTILGGLSVGTYQYLLQPWMNKSLVIPGGSSDSQVALGGGYTIPSRGMKIKGRVRRRCKDCYLIWVEGVLHNRCKTHPRHKQMLKPVYWSNQRILTHATSGFKRPW